MSTTSFRTGRVGFKSQLQHLNGSVSLDKSLNPSEPQVLPYEGQAIVSNFMNELDLSLFVAQVHSIEPYTKKLPKKCIK